MRLCESAVHLVLPLAFRPPPLAGLRSFLGKCLLSKIFFLTGSSFLCPFCSGAVQIQRTFAGFCKATARLDLQGAFFFCFTLTSGLLDLTASVDRITAQSACLQLRRKLAFCHFPASSTQWLGTLQAWSFSVLFHRRFDSDAGLASPVAPWTPVTPPAAGEGHLLNLLQIFDWPFLLWQVRATLLSPPGRQWRLLQATLLSINSHLFDRSLLLWQAHRICPYRGRRSWRLRKAPSIPLDFASGLW